MMMIEARRKDQNAFFKQLYIHKGQYKYSGSQTRMFPIGVIHVPRRRD